MPNTDTDWLGLARLAQESHHNRRSLEWRLSLGFIIAVAALTYFYSSLDPKTRPELPNDCVLVSFYVVAFLLTLSWQIPIQIAHAGDKAWLDYYRSKAMKENATKPTGVHWGGARGAFWLIGHIGFTLLVLLLSGLLLTDL